MTANSDKILRRIDELLASNPTAGVNLGDYVYGVQQASCIAWIASAGNLIERLVSDPHSAYRVLGSKPNKSVANRIGC